MDRKIIAALFHKHFIPKVLTVLKQRELIQKAACPFPCMWECSDFWWWSQCWTFVKTQRVQTMPGKLILPWEGQTAHKSKEPLQNTSQNHHQMCKKQMQRKPRIFLNASNKILWIIHIFSYFCVFSSSWAWIIWFLLYIHRQIYKHTKP